MIKGADAMDKANLPARITGDGFYDTDDGRLIVGTVKKCDVTQQTPWPSYDGSPDTTTYLVAKTLSAVQRWQNQRPIETVIETPERPLPQRTHDRDELDEWNAEIPKREWETGPDGRPRGPWQRAHFVYLVNSETCEQYTAVGGSIGMEIAVRELRKAVSLKRQLSRTNALPLVRLKTQPFKTAYGMKARPWFEIVGWANDSAPTAQLEPPPAARLEHEVPPCDEPAKRSKGRKAEPPPPWDDDDEQPLEETKPKRERLRVKM
jgi:hypothetical protein